MYSSKQDAEEYENSSKNIPSDNKRKNFYDAEKPKTRKLDKSKRYNDYVSKEDVLRRDLKRIEDSNSVLNNKLCESVCEISVLRSRLDMCCETLGQVLKENKKVEKEKKEVENILAKEKLKNQIIPLKNSKTAYQIIRKKTVVTCKDFGTDTKSLKNPAAHPIQTQTLKFNPEQKSVRTQVCAAELGVETLDSDVKVATLGKTCLLQTEMVAKSQYDKLFKLHKKTTMNNNNSIVQLNHKITDLVEEAQIWENHDINKTHFLESQGLLKKYEEWKLINLSPVEFETEDNVKKLEPSKD